MKKFPCNAPGCFTLVVGESLCERHKGEFSRAYRVCACGRAGITVAMADKCDQCVRDEDEQWLNDDYWNLDQEA